MFALGFNLLLPRGGYPVPPSRVHPRDNFEGSPQELKSYIAGNHLSICSLCITKLLTENNDIGSLLL